MQPGDCLREENWPTLQFKEMEPRLNAFMNYLGCFQICNIAGAYLLSVIPERAWFREKYERDRNAEV
jgi:hypothetical protein